MTLNAEARKWQAAVLSFFVFHYKERTQMAEEVKEGQVAPMPERPSDAELEAQRQSELAAEREKHNEKTGGGNYPLSTERH